MASIDLTKCAVCKGTMQDPKSLNCYHTFCLPCLTNLFKNDIIICPVCLSVNNIKDPSKVSDNIFIRKLTRSIISLENSNSNNLYENCKFDLCLIHVNKPIELFCNECDTLICCTCYFESHINHEFIKLSNNQILDETIKFTLDHLDSLSVCLSNEIENFENRTSNIILEKHSIEVQINQLKDDLITGIIRNVSLLNNQLDEHFSEEMNALRKIIQDINDMKKQCEDNKGKLLNAIDFNNYKYLLNIPQLSFNFISKVIPESARIFFVKSTNLDQSSIFLGKLSSTEDNLIEKKILCFHIIINMRYLPSNASIIYDPLKDDVGVISSLFPFSEENNYFEIKIISSGERGCIVIGIIYKHYPDNNQPGWLHNSWGYHADDGCIYSDGRVLTNYEMCEEGDRMGCGIVRVDNGFNVYFAKNDLKFGDYNIGPTLEKAYPAIGMHSRGESAIFIKSSPWEE